MNKRIWDHVLRTIRRYRTRDPFDILEAMGVIVQFSQSYEKKGLKGYCGWLNRIYYAVINAKEAQKGTPSYKIEFENHPNQKPGAVGLSPTTLSSFIYLLFPSG